MRTAMLLLMLATPALGQAQAGGPNPLAGPKVSAAAAATLVERDFQGRLRRLDLPPEEAALELISLTAEQRAACSAILQERAVILDKVVAGNLDLLVELANASQAGDKAALLRLAGEVYRELEPLRRRGSLESEFLRALPEGPGVRLQTLVGQYRTALRDEVVADAKAKGETLRVRQASARVALFELGQEIRRSYERQIAAGTAELEALIARLELRPEQDMKIRNMVSNFFIETKGKADAAQKRGLFLRVLAVLDGPQKRALLRYALQGP